jgi:hypothetical protein
VIAAALGGRFALGALFGVAGVGKLRAGRAAGEDALERFGVPAVVRAPLALALPVTELAVAALVLAPATAPAGAAAAAVLLWAFTAAMVRALARGERPDCHCFGDVQAQAIGPRTVARNVVLALAATAIALAAALGLDVVAVEAAALPAVVLAVLVSELPWGRPAERPSGPAIGSRAPAAELFGPDGGVLALKRLPGYGERLLLVFASTACGPCAALMPQLAAIRRARGYGGPRVVVVLPEGEAAPDYESWLDGVAFERADRASRAFGVTGTPTAVLLESGRVAASAAGAGPIRELLPEAPSDAAGAAFVGTVALPSLLGRPSRRQLIRAAGGGVLALTLVGRLAPAARADHCYEGVPKACQNTDGHFCCPENRECCHGANGYPTSCCGPCAPICNDGYCEAASNEQTDACCKDLGQGQACGELCCTEDQFCNHKLRKCCPPDPRDKCNAPDPQCKKQVDEDVALRKAGCDGAARGTENAGLNKEQTIMLGEASWGLKSCTFLAERERRRRYDECGQLASDTPCQTHYAGGIDTSGTCDGATMTCRRASCDDDGPFDFILDSIPKEYRPSRLAGSSADRTGGDAPARRARLHRAGSTVSPATIKRRLRARQKKVAAAEKRLRAALAASNEQGFRPDVGREAAALVAELARARASVAQGKGGSPQRYTLRALDGTARGIAAFAASEAATSTDEAVELIDDAVAAMRLAAKDGTKARGGHC